MVTHFGGVAGDSDDPSQKTLILSGPDPSWLLPMGAIGAAGIVAGGAGLLIGALRARRKDHGS